MKRETEALLRAQIKCAVETYLRHSGTFLSLGFFPSLSSPVVDDVIEPAALEDLENPLLAAFSPHGDVSGWVSPDLTAQRYGGGGAHGGWRDPRARPLRLPPVLRPIFCPAVPPQTQHTHRCTRSPAQGWASS